MTDLPDVSTLAAPLYLLLIAIELVAVQVGRWRGAYEGRDAATSITMGAGSVVVGALAGGAGYGLVFWAYEYRGATAPLTFAAVGLCFVLNDFQYYWAHRLGHRVRWLWANHVVHHSSQHFNLSTALRQPWTGPLTGTVILKVPLALMGFHPGVIAFVASANLLYQFGIHTRAVDRLPSWIEAIFNTPSHHRVHHGANPMYLDANYAGTFIVWIGSSGPSFRNKPTRRCATGWCTTSRPTTRCASRSTNTSLCCRTYWDGV